MFTILTLQDSSINCIVDNFRVKDIQIFDIDKMPIETRNYFNIECTKWFYEYSDKYSISYYLAMNNKNVAFLQYYKSIAIKDVIKFDGKIFRYSMNEKPKVKRKRVIYIEEMTIINK